MSPVLNGSIALQRFKRGNTVEIHNGIMFDFYLGLSQMVKVGKNVFVAASTFVAIETVVSLHWGCTTCTKHVPYLCLRWQLHKFYTSLVPRPHPKKGGWCYMYLQTFPCVLSQHVMQQLHALHDHVVASLEVVATLSSLSVCAPVESSPRTRGLVHQSSRLLALEG